MFREGFTTVYPDESRILTSQAFTEGFVFQLEEETTSTIYRYLLNLNKCLFACLKLTNCTHKDNGYYRGIIWELWLGDYSLKETKIMTRPETFKPSRQPSSIFPPDP